MANYTNFVYEYGLDIESAMKDVNVRKDLFNISYSGGYSPSLTREINGLDYQEARLEYFFIVPPDCETIADPIHVENNPLVSNDLKSIHPEIRKMLTQGSGKNIRITIPLLNNLVKLDTISMPEISTGVLEIGETRGGARQILPEWRMQSQASQDFSVTYQDVYSPKLGPAVIMKLHKAWELYINNVKSGSLHPGKKYAMIFNDKTKTPDGQFNGWYQKRLNFVGSAYYFKLAPDGRTIVYWCKWTGIYPKSSSVDQYSGSSKEPGTSQVSYQSQFFEELDTDIIKEFNQLNMLYRKPSTNYNQNIILRNISDGSDYTYKLYYNTPEDRALVNHLLTSVEERHEIVYSYLPSTNYMELLRSKSQAVQQSANYAITGAVNAYYDNVKDSINSGKAVLDMMDADLAWITSSIEGNNKNKAEVRVKEVDISMFAISVLAPEEVTKLNDYYNSLFENKDRLTGLLDNVKKNMMIDETNAKNSNE